MYWQKFCWDTENLPIGFINSSMMEKRSKLSMMGQYLLENLGLAKISPFTSDLVKAYDAPFPDPSFKMGPRAMPSHVPILPDASLDAQREAREFFKTSTKGPYYLPTSLIPIFQKFIFFYKLSIMFHFGELNIMLLNFIIG